MGVKTTYTCDRCNAEQDTNKQMWDVALSYRCREGGYSAYTTNRGHLWCRICCIATGVLTGDKSEEKELKVKEVRVPTFEELVRYIAQEVIDEQEGTT